MHQIFNDAKSNNPIADWWIIQIKGRISLAMEKIAGLETILDNIPTVPNRSLVDKTKPESVCAYSFAPLCLKTYLALTNYDKICEKAHSLEINRKVKSDILRQGSKAIRSIFHLALTYKEHTITRWDVLHKTTTALTSKCELNHIPSEVLLGHLRSGFAPAIKKPTQSITR